MEYANKGIIGNFVEDVPNEVKEAIADLIDPNMSKEERDKIYSSINIVDDERMYYYYDQYSGEVVNVDVILNMSGSIRRLNPAQLTEVETNFIGEQIQRRLPTLKTLEEKEHDIFTFLNLVNEEECSFYMDMYKGYEYNMTINNHNFKFLNREAKEAFIKDVEENGFYLIRPPHKPLLYDDIKKMYEAFPWIKPVQLYINLFGIKDRKVMRKGVVGFEYMIILKQTSRKNFSARSTYRINRSNLPTKDIAKKTNKSSYARTPVRLSEIYALMPSISGRDLAEYNIFMRSSAIGRKSLERILSAEGNPLEIKKLKVRDNYINANAQILNARLKCIGLRLNFKSEKYTKPDVYSKTGVAMQVHGYTIVDVPTRYDDYVSLFEKYENEMKSFTMIESYVGEKSDICWDKAFEDESTKALGFSDDTKEMLKVMTSKRIISIKDLIKVKPKKPVQLVEEVTESGEIILREPKKRGRKPKKQQSEEI